MCNTAIPANQFGWVQIYGATQGTANAAITSGIALDVATGGEVDPSEPNGDLTGCYSTSGASANNPVNVFLHRPYYT